MEQNMTQDIFAYPRPQLVRENWLSLNGKWKFMFDDENQFPNFSNSLPWATEILVPFPPESEASGVGDRGYHYACWYEREFEISAKKSARIIAFWCGRLSCKSVG